MESFNKILVFQRTLVDHVCYNILGRVSQFLQRMAYDKILSSNIGILFIGNDLLNSPEWSSLKRNVSLN